MKKLLLIGVIGLSSFAAVGSPTVEEFREKAAGMDNTTLCLTMGIAQTLASAGKPHDAVAMKNMETAFYERVNNMDEVQLESCQMAWALGQISATE